MSRLWKVSLGLAEIDNLTFNWLIDNNYLMIHKNTAGGQVEDYQDRMKIGDIVLLCRSRYIVGLVEVTGNIERNRLPESLCPNGDPWLLRSFKKLEWLGLVPAKIEKADGTLLRKWWSPHANRTIRDVPGDELKYFEKVILNRYFSEYKTLESLHISYNEEKQIDMPVLTKDEAEMLEEYHSKNIIFYGPPGTGKTHTIQKIMDEYIKITSDTNNSTCFDGKVKRQINNYELVTFHQSYSYEDFVEGLRAETDVDGVLNYRVVSGVFKNLCIKALENPTERFALFIDEINRGNISNIFGELISLIEVDKRTSPEVVGLEVRLPYSGEKFSVPNNIDIYGTMNTSDHSLTSIDIALRRRFEFVEMMPDYGMLQNIEVYGVNIAKLLEVINQRIEVLIGRDFIIGHSYFISLEGLDSQVREKHIGKIFEYQIIPLLQEYFYADWERIQWVLNDQNKKDSENQFIQLLGGYQEARQSLAGIFPQALIDEEGLIDRRYRINKRAFGKQEAYQQILLSN